MKILSCSSLKLVPQILCLGLIGCGGGGGSDETSVPNGPSISSFTISKSEIVRFEEVSITAFFEGGTASIKGVSPYTGEIVYMPPPGLSIVSGEPIKISPGEDSIYTLSVQGGGEAVSSDVSLTIVRYVSVGDASSFEGDSGEQYLRFPIRVNRPALGNIDVYSSVQESTARSGLDFNNTIRAATIVSGFLEADILIPILPDSVPEEDEEVILTLTSVTGNAALDESEISAIGNILNDDKAVLNDTGITFSGNFSSGNSDCRINFALGQDCARGRDVTDIEDTLDAGAAGFHFAKLTNSGTRFPDQHILYNNEPWPCVQDNTTGLIWEVKTTDGGLRDRRWSYTSFDVSFFEDDVAEEAGADGIWAGPIDLGINSYSDNCDDIDFVCGTDQYLDTINGIQLCGYSDWRVPSREELRSIVDYGGVNPTIDPDFFPNSQGGFYLSSTPYVQFNDTMWVINFATGEDAAFQKRSDFYVRVVRGPRYQN